MTYDELLEENARLKKQNESLKKAYEMVAELAVSYAARAKEAEKKCICRGRPKKEEK